MSVSNYFKTLIKRLNIDRKYVLFKFCVTFYVCNKWWDSENLDFFKLMNNIEKLNI